MPPVPLTALFVILFIITITINTILYYLSEEIKQEKDKCQFCNAHNHLDTIYNILNTVSAWFLLIKVDSSSYWIYLQNHLLSSSAKSDQDAPIERGIAK